MHHLQEWFAAASGVAKEFPLFVLGAGLILLNILHIAKATIIVATHFLEWIEEEVRDIAERLDTFMRIIRRWLPRRRPPPMTTMPPLPSNNTPPPAQSHLDHAKRSTIRELRAYSGSFGLQPRVARRQGPAPLPETHP